MKAFDSMSKDGSQRLILEISGPTSDMRPEADMPCCWEQGQCSPAEMPVTSLSSGCTPGGFGAAAASGGGFGAPAAPGGFGAPAASVGGFGSPSPLGGGGSVFGGSAQPGGGFAGFASQAQGFSSFARPPNSKALASIKQHFWNCCIPDAHILQCNSCMSPAA